MKVRVLAAAMAASVVIGAGAMQARADDSYTETFDNKTALDWTSNVTPQADFPFPKTLASGEYGRTDDIGGATGWDDVGSTFGDGWVASLDIYVPDSGTSGDSFDWSIRVNKTGGGILDTFYFNALYKADITNGPLAYHFGVSEGGAADPGTGSYPTTETISNAGWYTFQSTFRDDGSGNLAVDMAILSGTTNIQSWTINTTDAIGGANGVSGIGEGYLLLHGPDAMGIDNASLTPYVTSVVPVPDSAYLALAALGLLGLTLAVRRRRDLAACEC